jgi:hypothetical protein
LLRHDDLASILYHFLNLVTDGGTK